MGTGVERDWVGRLADEVIAAAERRSPGQPIVCASGLSPSGPIHLGNLREVMTPHLVADEIRRRGYTCEHLLSWDDFDRLRKVPAGIDEIWSEHIGKPLSLVPPPPGSRHENWAEHYKAAMIESLVRLGVSYRGISQTEQYTSGAYVEQIVLAMRERRRIDETLETYRTAGKPTVVGDEIADGDIARPGDYYPYRPYCTACFRDSTTVTSYDDRTTELEYVCAYGHGERVRLDEFHFGKLVWKVDWPMRWAYEGVHFEPSGVDHTSPGSSFVVGTHVVREVFGGEAPIGPMYAFVGITGMAKMSSSRGNVPTPGDALEILEAPLLRWLYARRRPAQSFAVAFDQEIHRLYDEWDALSSRVAKGSATSGDAIAYDRARRTSDGDLPATPRVLPYRMLASVADITTGEPAQMYRILHELDPLNPIESLDDVRPRLDRAVSWARNQMPADQRTTVLAQADTELLEHLDSSEREALRLLLDGLSSAWSLSGLTNLVYGVPKMLLGLPHDAPPSSDLKTAQRTFFILLYRLLTGGATGPRLPTLLLSIGEDRVRRLLTAQS